MRKNHKKTYIEIKATTIIILLIIIMAVLFIINYETSFKPSAIGVLELTKNEYNSNDYYQVLISEKSQDYELEIAGKIVHDIHYYNIEKLDSELYISEKGTFIKYLDNEWENIEDNNLIHLKELVITPSEIIDSLMKNPEKISMKKTDDKKLNLRLDTSNNSTIRLLFNTMHEDFDSLKINLVVDGENYSLEKINIALLKLGENPYTLDRHILITKKENLQLPIDPLNNDLKSL